MNPTRLYLLNNTIRCPQDTFGFSDIQKGDKIRITKTHTDGTELICTGVADGQRMEGTSQARWTSKSGSLLVGKTPADGWSFSYELLDRPKPVTDHVVTRVSSDGTVRVVTLPTTLEEATDHSKKWNEDYSARERGFDYKVMKLVEVAV